MTVPRLRPSRRTRLKLNKQKVTTGNLAHRRDVKNADRSHDVYENKGHHDKMPGKMSDICYNYSHGSGHLLQLETNFAGKYGLCPAICFENAIASRRFPVRYALLTDRMIREEIKLR
jgi:hypothetical protein